MLSQTDKHLPSTKLADANSFCLSNWQQLPQKVPYLPNCWCKKMREHLSMLQYRMSEGEANPGRVVCIIRKRYGRCNLLICGGSQLLSEISFCFFAIDFSQNKIFAICIMIWKDSIRLQSTQLQSLYCQPNRSLQQICSSDHFVLI